MKRTKKALKQSLSLTLRTVPKPVNRADNTDEKPQETQKRPMTSLEPILTFHEDKSEKDKGEEDEDKEPEKPEKQEKVQKVARRKRKKKEKQGK